MSVKLEMENKSVVWIKSRKLWNLFMNHIGPIEYVHPYYGKCWVVDAS